MSAKPLLSRELKSFQEKLAPAQRQGPVKSANRRAGPAVHTATGPAPATIEIVVAPTRRLPAHFVSTVVLAAALPCVALPMAISALSDGGLFIVNAQAQSRQQNPLDQARKAVETLINRLRGRDMPEGIVKTNGRIEATQVDVSAKYPGRLARRMITPEPDSSIARPLLAPPACPALRPDRLRPPRIRVLTARHRPKHPRPPRRPS